MRFLTFFFGLFALSISVSAANIPIHIELNYQVSTDIGDGEIQEVMEIKHNKKGSSYVINSEAQATGVFKIVEPSRLVRHSEGILTKQGLRPLRAYERHGKKEPNSVTLPEPERVAGDHETSIARLDDRSCPGVPPGAGCHTNVTEMAPWVLIFVSHANPRLSLNSFWYGRAFVTQLPASPPAIPRLHQVGRFRLVAEIARGGMGVVYLARADDGEGREELFAVKTLLPEYAGEEQYRRMFLDEANLGVRLEHPNIVRTVEVGGSKKQHYMALEYLEGQSLRAVRKAVRDLSLEDGLRILSDVLRALHYAHTLCHLGGTPLHVVHRDMSPENVFLTYDRRVILLDFGVAKANDGGSKTEVGKLKGRIRYMAPEQVLGTQVDGRADVFAVGILLWEIITNRRFWDGIEEVVILRRLLEGDIPALPEGARTPKLAAVCARGLVRTGLNTTFTGMCLDAPSAAAISFECSATCSNVLGPYKC